MGTMTVLDFSTDIMIDLWCHDCGESLSEGGNNLTRPQALRVLRRHHAETGHTDYTANAMGSVRIPKRWSK